MPRNFHENLKWLYTGTNTKKIIQSHQLVYSYTHMHKYVFMKIAATFGKTNTAKS